MSTESLLTVFFKNMAQKYQKENDLSDITWCMMNTIPDFNRIFLKFLDISILEDEVIQDCQREYVIQDSRIDFLLRPTRR